MAKFFYVASIILMALSGGCTLVWVIAFSIVDDGYFTVPFGLVPGGFFILVFFMVYVTTKNLLPVDERKPNEDKL